MSSDVSPDTISPVVIGRSQRGHGCRAAAGDELRGLARGVEPRFLEVGHREQHAGAVVAHEPTRDARLA
jgi:hypothetical protein